MVVRNYGGGMCGMRGSIGPFEPELTLVESRAVRVPVSRPGSGPFLKINSSPRLVPGVCDGILVLDPCVFGVGMASPLC
jgi:hypothetical protein